MEQERFEFNIDQQIITWQRTRFAVEASSMEEARETVREAFNRGGLDAVMELDTVCDDDVEMETLVEFTEDTGKEELYDYYEYILLESRP